MEKKIRIQKFDEEGRLIDDKVVTQDPEFYTGPKMKHNGPLRIEFSLLNKDDVEKCKFYLDQLVGDLPLSAKKGKKKKVSKFEGKDPEHRKELLESVLTHAKDQDEFIQAMKEQEFKFLTWDFLKTFNYPIDIKKMHREYQFLIRCIKEAKNPMSDKYDPMLIIGINMLERQPKMIIYLDGSFLKSVELPIPKKNALTFKKTEMMKFPHYMVDEEKDKFRYEIRQYQNNPDKKLSKFFKRWLPYVENVPKISQLKDK